MIANEFRRHFGTGGGALRVFRAPGRVNLIGEHTDYNLGFVLPVALHLACFVVAADSADGRFRIHSESKNETKEWPAAEVCALKPAHDWSDYIVGVAQELARAGYPVRPQSLLIRGTVPEGAGLSASAALEVSCALAILGDRGIAPLTLAQLCHRAEQNFAGLPCGIMDQYISVFGRKDAALKIDCRSLECEPVALPADVEIVAVNSMVKHSLGETAYRERTEECAAAVDAIRRIDPAVGSLRDANVTLLEKASMPKLIARRARHVVTENDRVNLFIASTRRGDLDRMGQLMVESHLSLQHDYEVSCAELDFLVDAAVGMDGVLGARLTGGGFGGCTVNLLRRGAAADFRKFISHAYLERFGVNAQVFDCRPADGAGEIKNFEKNPELAALTG